MGAVKGVAHAAFLQQSPFLLFKNGTPDTNIKWM